MMDNGTSYIGDSSSGCWDSSSWYNFGHYDCWCVEANCGAADRSNPPHGQVISGPPLETLMSVELAGRNLRTSPHSLPLSGFG